jgi:hypothetical protein
MSRPRKITDGWGDSCASWPSAWTCRKRARAARESHRARAATMRHAMHGSEANHALDEALAQTFMTQQHHTIGE